MLGLLGSVHRVGVGEDEHPVIAFDGALMPADVTRRPGMAARMEVAHTHPVACAEPGRDVRVDPRRRSLAEGRRDLCLRQRRLGDLLRVPPLARALDLLAGHQPLLDQQLLEAVEPGLVVAAAQVIRRRRVLARKARHIDVPAAHGARGEGDRKDAALPIAVEHRLVLLGLDGAHALHAAHVVRAVHAPPPPGTATIPVPIIASRVTMSASASALHPSVPSGRMGSTR